MSFLDKDYGGLEKRTKVGIYDMHISLDGLTIEEKQELMKGLRERGKKAVFSQCHKYRYVLTRIWDNKSNLAIFICLNPSTADEQLDDRTVSRCINYAKGWGCGGVIMLNLFAYRSTDPEGLLMAPSPIGNENDAWLSFFNDYSQEDDLFIAAWGNNGKYLNRYRKACNIFNNLYCLKLNKTGQPAHPLYLKPDLKPIPFNCLNES